MRSTFALVCLLTLSAPWAEAADLARQSPLGAVFAERPARVIIRGEPQPPPPSDAGFIAYAPRVPGYYGRPGDFAYRNYYGTSPVAIFTRLPYACGWYGLC
jgi:hypothetical protein